MSKRSKARQAQKIPQQQKTDAAVDTYITRGRECFDNNEPSRATQFYQQAINLAPKRADLPMELGKRLLQAGRKEKGTERLNNALEINPELVPALVTLGQHYGQNNDLEKAEPLAKRALKLNPDHPNVYLVYGTILQRRGALPDAVEHFRKALQLRLDQQNKFPTQVATKKEEKGFSESKNEELLWDTLNQLALGNVHAFPYGGTLLGLVREGGLLDHDKDIDIGLPYSELERAIRCLESHGWVELKGYHMSNPRTIVHPGKRMTIDLCGFAVDEQGNTLYGFWQNNIPHKWNRKLAHPPMQLAKAKDPEGRAIWELQNAEEWLESIYGKGWTKPDLLDSGLLADNLVDFSYMSQSYSFSQICSNWEKGKLQHALRLTERSLAFVEDDELLTRVRSVLRIALNKARNSAPKAEPAEG